MPRVTAFKFINESSCECSECGLVIARPSDMRRHMRTHGLGMTGVKYQCAWEGCSFEALQKSNFDTHYRTHLRDKSHACPSCDFKTCDPGSLTRHRKRIHAYVPKPRKARAKKQSASSDRSISPSLTWISSESNSDLSPPSSLSNSTPESNMDFSSLNSTIDVEASTTPDIDEICKPLLPPTDLDDLFYQPDSVSGFDYYSTFDDLRPRPLLPAMDSAPSLEAFVPLHSSCSTDFSLLLAAAYDTLPLTTIPYIDSNEQSFYRVSCGLFQDGIGDLMHQPLPTPYDSIIQQMARMDPSLSVTISDYDFRIIFGCDYEQFVAAKARKTISPWPGPQCSSGSANSTTTSISTTSSSHRSTGSLLAELYAPVYV